MTIQGFAPNPATSNGGDTGQLMKNLGDPAEPHNLSTVKLGSELVTFGQPRAFFVRYELDIPAGAKILGIRFNYTVGIGSLGTTIDITGGLINRQNNSAAWEKATGVGIWTNQNDIPFPEFQNVFGGITQDDSQFYGGAPAFKDVTMPILTGLFSKWSVVEGTFTGGTAADVTGIIEQLQNYLDDPANESTRGDTKANAISALMVFYRSFIGTADQYQVLRTANDTNAANHPFLDIEWGFEPVVTITSPAVPPTVSVGTNINFVATSIDVEDGDISTGIVWSSDLDGALGTGASVNVNTLSLGTHIVEAKSTDSDGQIGTDTIVVIVSGSPSLPFIENVSITSNILNVSVSGNLLGVNVTSDNLDIAIAADNLDVAVAADNLDVAVAADNLDVSVES